MDNSSKKLANPGSDTSGLCGILTYDEVKARLQKYITKPGRYVYVMTVLILSTLNKILGSEAWKGPLG